MSSGAVSNGRGMETDNESARLSNVQTYKYNSLKQAGAAAVLGNKSSIRKIAPDGSKQTIMPKSRGNGSEVYNGPRGRNAASITE
jgi:hypothetical protein